MVYDVSREPEIAGLRSLQPEISELKLVRNRLGRGVLWAAAKLRKWLPQYLHWTSPLSEAGSVAASLRSYAAGEAP